MERLERLFFEEPLYVYVTLVFVELVLAAIWHERRSRKLLLLLAVPPVVAGIVFLVSSQVVTDRERIVQAAEAVARDLEAGSVAAAERYLADDYSGLGVNKAGAIATGASIIRTYEIGKIKLTKVNVAVDGPVAAMQVTTIITLEGGARGSLDWQLRWAKRPEGWRIVHIQNPEARPGLF